MWVGNVMANPTGMTVAGGSAPATVNGSQLTITTSRNASLNWQSFNIAAGETPFFNNPLPPPSSGTASMTRIHRKFTGACRPTASWCCSTTPAFISDPTRSEAPPVWSFPANCNPAQNSGGGWEFNGRRPGEHCQLRADQYRPGRLSIFDCRSD